MPPWFIRALAECESLSLDVASDRRKLWAAVARHLPDAAIRDAIAGQIGTAPPSVHDVHDAIMGVLR